MGAYIWYRCQTRATNAQGTTVDSFEGRWNNLEVGVIKQPDDGIQNQEMSPLEVRSNTSFQ